MVHQSNGLRASESSIDVAGSAAPLAFGQRRRPMLSDYPCFPILLSKDLDATRDFYHGLLGLEIAREDEGDRIVFRCGGTQLVVTLSTVGTSDMQTQVAWRVPDIKAAVAELRGRGVRIE